MSMCLVCEHGRYVLRRCVTTPRTVTTPPTVRPTILQQYPHDSSSFTEGLVCSTDGTRYYESSGLYGQSELREVELTTGKVLRFYRLPVTQFAEGLTLTLDGRLVQLTWKEHVARVYNLTTFQKGPVATFSWPKEGWGLTYGNGQLIISDGSAQLYFLNSQAPYEVQRTVTVRTPVGGKLQTLPRLNELEWVKGLVYANLWQEKRIAVIDPVTGLVQRFLDLSFLPSPDDNEAVLNGIAYCAVTNSLYVTGKRWSVLYKITI